MERLTIKNWRNFDPWECCGQDNFCTRGCHEKGGCNNGCIVPKLYGRLAAYEDTGLEPGDLQSTVNINYVRFMELLKADKAGRLAVLPFVPHSTMLNLSDPENPEFMKDVCLHVAWKSSSGIVFHSPYNCFWQDIEKGYIKPFSEEAEAALAGKGGDG